MKFIESALPKKTKMAFDKTKNIHGLTNFYLSGGTALSLQLGHRESEDLDFFTQQEFNPELLQTKLATLGYLNNVEIEKNTLNLFLNEVKLQFLYYPYQLLQNPVLYQNISISSVLDVACTKLITISSRGSKKDFIDLFVILQSFTLNFLFESLDKKYKGINYNHLHIIKSLVFFEDADIQPMPRLHIDTNWEEIKKIITQKVINYQSLCLSVKIRP